MNEAELIKHHEGLRLRPYRCTAGRLTIGYGHNLEDNGISREQAEMLLADDIYECRQSLQHNLLFWPELDKVRQAVLVDMCFNLGWPRLSRFKKMLNALALKDFGSAAAEMMDSRWAKQVPRRAARLVRMMSTGQWPENLG